MYLTLILILMALVTLIFAFSFVMKFLLTTSKKKKTLNKKDKAIIVKNSNRRLAQNPKDPKALLSLSNLYYEEGDYSKAMRTFSLLMELARYNHSLDFFDITKKYAISLLKCGKKEEAYKIFLEAHKIRISDFEVNYNLGILEYLKKRFDIAAHLLRIVQEEKPSHPGISRYLGLVYHKLHRHKEALVELQKALTIYPDNKEIMFAIAQSYNVLGNKEQALNSFDKLKDDPHIGSMATLLSGKILFQSGNLALAIKSFQMGLAHKEVKWDIVLELKYNLAMCYIQQQDLPNAMIILKELHAISPTYKDVLFQIQKYDSLAANKNLSLYLLASAPDFSILCKNICKLTFPEAQVKFIDVSIIQNQYLDISTEIVTKRWQDHIHFRFIRTTGKTSDLIVRELYAKIKEEHVRRAICMTAGVFTEEAHRFVEARLIDLIERDALEKRLQTLPIKMQ